MGKADYLNINEQLASIYGSLGYSENHKLYDYKEYDEDLMEYDGINEKAKRFKLKQNDIMAILKVITESAAYQRTSQKSMMATRSNTMIPPENSEELKQIFNDSEALVQTRQTHMREVAEIAKMISNALGLNSEFAYIIGLSHDVGHTWNGHSGERILSSIARLENCGYVVHNAMGAYILERENIIDIAIEEVKQFNPKASEEEIREFMRYVIDGVVSHNGEGVIGKIVPDNKTAEKMSDEIKKCFTEKGYDKRIMPATLEGAIIRYADIIAYTRSDILDGFRLRDVNGKKIMSEFDDDYLSIIGTVLARENNYEKMLDLENKFLVELYGLSKRIDELGRDNEETNTPENIIELRRTKKEREMIEIKYQEFVQCKIKYALEYIKTIKPQSEVKTRITQMMQNVFIKDLIEASKGKNYITMTPLIRRTFFSLRDLNVRRIVPYTRRSFEATDLPIATKNLVDVFSDVLLKTGVAYKAIPEDERQDLVPTTGEELQDKERKKIEESNTRFDFERKLIHYYSRQKPEKMREMYLNAVAAIRDIAIHDIEIATGAEKYDGELKEIYEIEKINPIRRKIGEMCRTSDMMTKENKETLLEELVGERIKDIEKILASKMAVEYIGGMTDNTILAALLDKNIISRKQLIEGYGRAEPGKQHEDTALRNLQQEFSNIGKLILPDDIDEDGIHL